MQDYTGSGTAARTIIGTNIERMEMGALSTARYGKVPIHCPAEQHSREVAIGSTGDGALPLSV